ncbi:hypothetical protein NL431_28395, partial [Klebsiella pneumoniae]|nr:hypothetical protein [Klebsiella pneumoniae]
MANVASLNGTIRTYNPDLRALAKKDLFSLSEDIAAAHGASVKIDFIDGYPALYNHPTETQTVVDIFKER